MCGFRYPHAMFWALAALVSLSRRLPGYVIAFRLCRLALPRRVLYFRGIAFTDLRRTYRVFISESPDVTSGRSLIRCRRLIRSCCVLRGFLIILSYCVAIRCVR